MLSPTLIAAFVAGLAGSAHCFAMCGGFAGALGVRAHQHARSPLDRSLRALTYQLGRVGGYAGLGAIGGTFGHSAHWALNFTRFEPALRIVAGVLMLLIAARVLTRRNAFASLERAAAKLWVRLQPLAKRASLGTGSLSSILMGLLWGLLPCGLVYSMLLVTLTTESPMDGATVMIAFGLGTLPAMAASSITLSGSWQRSRPQWLRKATGVLLLTFGVWMIGAAGLNPPHSGHSSIEHHS